MISIRRVIPALFFGVGALSCGGRKSVLIEPAWPMGQIAVVMVTDQDGRPIENAPRLLDGSGALTFGVELSGTALLYIESFLPKALGGPDLAGCGVRFGGSGGRLPEPAGAWISDPIPSGGGRASLHARSQNTNIDLRYSSCAAPSPPTVCDKITAQTLRGFLLNTTLEKVAVVSTDQAFFAGQDLFTEKRGLWTFERTRGPTAIDLPPISGASIGLAWDEGAQVLFAGFESGEVFEVGREGAVLAQPVTGLFAVLGLAGDREGGAFVFDGRKVVKVRAGSPAVEDATDRFPAEMTSLRVLEREHILNRQHMIAIAAGAIVELTGGDWRPALGGQGIEVDDRTRAISGNKDLLAFVGENEIRVSDSGSGRWMSIPEAFLTGQSHDGIVIGKGLLAVGLAGRAAIWNGRSWCPIDTGGISGLNSVDATSDGHAAIAVGDGTVSSRGPIITRFDIPVSP